jgi:PAS domain S-box-containing protein
MLPDEPQILSRIETLLKHYRKGLTTSEITRHLKGNRNSTAKYLAILQTSGIVEKNRIGASSVYTLSRKVSPLNLLNCFSEMILVLDSDGRVALVNDTLPAFFGTDRKSMESRTLAEIPIDLFQNLAGADGIGDMTEEFFRTIDIPVSGQPRHLRVRGLPVVFDDRRSGYTLVIGDLSEQKQAEEQLRQSEAKYRAVIEEQTDLICRRKPGGTITFANNAYHRFFRKDPGTLEGSDFYPVDLMPGLAAGPDPARARILPFCNDVFEQCLMLDNGEVRWVQWKNSLRMDSSGEPAEILSVGRDITQQRQREREIIIGRCAIESSDIAAVIFDIMGRIVYTNRRFFDLFHCTPGEELSGNLLERFIPHDFPSDNICQLANSLQETGRWDGLVRGKRTDGTVIDLEMHAVVIRNDRYFPMNGLALMVLPKKPGLQSCPIPAAKSNGQSERPSGVLIVDPAGKILKVNRDFLAMTGYGKKLDVLGHQAGGIVRLGRDGDPGTAFSAAGENGQHPGIVRHQDGSEIPVMVCLNPIYESGGALLCSEVRITPDTDRTIGTFAEGADFWPFPTFAIDRDKKVLIWNRAIEAFTHVHRSSIVGTSEYRNAFYPYHGMQASIIDLVEEPLEVIRQLYPEIQKFGNVLVLERYIPDSDRNQGMYLLEKASPLTAPDGSVIGALESILDITEWRRSKDLLDRMRDEIESGLNIRFSDLVERIGTV